jgi:uncharacterized protein (TIGR02246 family)
MSRFIVTIAAALLVVSVSACNDEPLTTTAPTSNIELQASVAGSPGDVEAMQQIVDTFDAAWTAGDYVTYAGQYADVKDWVGPTGVVLTNPAAIAGLYRNVFTGFFAGSTRHSTIRAVTFLSGTLAVLDIDTRVTGFSSLPPGVVPWQPGTTRVLEKNILQKRGGEWRIIRHQQTSVAPGVL